MPTEAQWEVRTPLVYWSACHSFHATEAQARAEAEKIATDLYRGAGLQIHTKQRVIYIDHNEDE